jgi:hypothetical protein
MEQGAWLGGVADPEQTYEDVAPCAHAIAETPGGATEHAVPDRQQ